ncbi:hypothetical protein DFQ29_009569, partial [Apophysomyces sp. BC1021]
IKPYMEANQTMQPNSFCTLPEAVAHLPTLEGQTVFRRQYHLAEKQKPLIKETIEKWKADGIIREVPPDVPHGR